MCNRGFKRLLGPTALSSVFALALIGCKNTGAGPAAQVRVDDQRVQLDASRLDIQVDPPDIQVHVAPPPPPDINFPPIQITLPPVSITPQQSAPETARPLWADIDFSPRFSFSPLVSGSTSVPVIPEQVRVTVSGPDHHERHWLARASFEAFFLILAAVIGAFAAVLSARIQANPSSGTGGVWYQRQLGGPPGIGLLAFVAALVFVAGIRLIPLPGLTTPPSPDVQQALEALDQRIDRLEEHLHDDRGGGGFHPGGGGDITTWPDLDRLIDTIDQRLTELNAHAASVDRSLRNGREGSSGLFAGQNKLAILALLIAIVGYLGGLRIFWMSRRRPREPLGRTPPLGYRHRARGRTRSRDRVVPRLVVGSEATLAVIGGLLLWDLVLDGRLAEHARGVLLIVFVLVITLLAALHVYEAKRYLKRP